MNPPESSQNKIYWLCTWEYKKNIFIKQKTKEEKDKRLIMSFSVFKYTDMFKKRVLEVILKKKQNANNFTLYI